MQTTLARFVQDHRHAEELQSILRSCVHCGFCNAACPTYQQLGDERDGPRGRIYLLKELLEGGSAGKTTQQHIDRCIGCLACETACPSGVKYGRLVDAGKHLLEQTVPRSLWQRLQRLMLVLTVPYHRRFALMFFFARLVRCFLPAAMRLHPAKPLRRETSWPAARHDRRVLLLDGCVQPKLAPGINAAAARVLDAIGWSAVRLPRVCCGALAYHTGDEERALVGMRQHIDACWPAVEDGIEAILSTASGCGCVIKEYDYLLQHDPDYAAKAQRIAELTQDIGEFLAGEDLSPLSKSAAGTAEEKTRVAWQNPCSLQHAQKLNGVVEAILIGHGYELTRVEAPTTCCGAGGAYSILQPKMATTLRQEKQERLLAGRPDYIASANVGCVHHLQVGAAVPVVHWIELLDP